MTSKTFASGYSTHETTLKHPIIMHNFVKFHIKKLKILCFDEFYYFYRLYTISDDCRQQQHHHNSQRYRSRKK